MRLWQRLFLVMAGVGVLPFLLFGGLAVDLVYDRVRQASDEAISHEASLHAQRLGQWFEAQAAAAQTWSALFGARFDALSAEAKTSFLALVVRNTPDARRAMVLNGEGVPLTAVADAGALSDVHAWRERIPVAAAVGAPEQAHFGAPWHVPSGGGIGASVPLVVVLQAGATPEDVRLLALELSLAARLESVGQRPVALLDGFGRTVRAHPDVPFEVDDVRPLAATGQPADFELRGEKGEVRGAFAPVLPNQERLTLPSDGPVLSVVVAEPSHVVLAAANSVRNQLFRVAVFGVWLSGACAYFFGLTLSAPVEALTQAARRIRSGEVGVTAALKRRDEIGELGEAFDDMSERLGQHRLRIEEQNVQIRAFNHELQDMVEARTAELKDAQRELVASRELVAAAEVGAGLAHELNTPLSVVLGYTEMLAEELPDNSMVAAIGDAARQCGTVVSALAGPAAIDESSAQQAPQVSLAEIVGWIQTDLGGPAEQANIRLRVLPLEPEADVSVAINGGHLRRVIQHLSEVLFAGLPAHAALVWQASAEDDPPGLVVSSEAALADAPETKDGYMAAGNQMWVARQLLDRWGGALLQDEQVEGLRWHLQLPRSA